MSDPTLRRQHAQEIGEGLRPTGILAHMDEWTAGLLSRKLDQGHGKRCQGVEKASFLGAGGSAARSGHQELEAGLGGKRLPSS